MQQTQQLPRKDTVDTQQQKRENHPLSTAPLA
jgi:hypothetical protein